MIVFEIQICTTDNDADFALAAWSWVSSATTMVTLSSNITLSPSSSVEQGKQRLTLYYPPVQPGALEDALRLLAGSRLFIKVWHQKD